MAAATAVPIARIATNPATRSRIVVSGKGFKKPFPLESGEFALLFVWVDVGTLVGCTPLSMSFGAEFVLVAGIWTNSVVAEPVATGVAIVVVYN